MRPWLSLQPEGIKAGQFAQGVLGPVRVTFGDDAEGDAGIRHVGKGIAADHIHRQHARHLLLDPARGIFQRRHIQLGRGDRAVADLGLGPALHDVHGDRAGGRQAAGGAASGFGGRRWRECS